VSTLAVLCLMLTLLLSACATGDDEKSDEPTPAGSGPTATASADEPTRVASTVEPEDLSDVNGQIISDGLCQALIPDGWVDDGTGRGTTTSGGRFVLFGGRAATDSDWERAADVVGTPTAGRAIDSLEREDDAVRALFAEDRGFEYRKRFDTLYCDLTVTSGKAVPETERAFWDAIIESLKPAE
jgi:hypothetical protein